MNCLPKEQFVSREYLNQMTCAIGLGIFNDPVALPCQHVFCKACIEAWLNKNGTCPKCRETFCKESLRPQWIFAKIISNSLVACSNPDCKWTGPFSSLNSHLFNECLESSCYCPFGCGEQAKRSDLPAHEKVCELRVVECKYCNVKGPYNVISKHEANCCKNIVTCPNACGKTLPAADVKAHVKEECDKGEMKCKFKKLTGCSFTGTKDQLLEHYANAKEDHLVSLANTVNKLQSKITDIEKSRRGSNSLISQAVGRGICWSNGSLKVAGSANNGWSVFLSKKTLVGPFRVKIQITKINASDTNGWKICLGVINSPQYAPGSWGKYKNAWGYIMGTGNKVHTESVAYGSPYGIGDVITIEYKNRELTFYRNGISQTVAYDNINGPFYLAAALSDVGHSVEIIDISTARQFNNSRFNITKFTLCAIRLLIVQMAHERSFKKIEESELLHRIAKLETRLDNNEGLVKLSEEIVRLKEEELENESKIRHEKYVELEARIGRLEKRMDKVELKFGGLEEKMKVGLEEIKKKQELSMKRTEITDFMLKKFEIIQNTFEQNEKKLAGLIEKRVEEMTSETDHKLMEIVNTVDEAGHLVKELSEKASANAEGLEKLEGELLNMMKALNEQSIKTQNIQWMHDELMTIKKRELQIINLLKDQSNVEAEFLTQLCTPPTDNNLQLLLLVFRIWQLNCVYAQIINFAMYDSPQTRKYKKLQRALERELRVNLEVL
eukprot:TRINITY_DN952_c1_g1_i2.p2 TRINITY_DN952_c1_g1~~TRINITY_DN952_c1_g1_i2.p2  ORF type:complete len:758 (+),score=63.41 TRINITY_DN952_c1_g1_i2:102-2276(+)